MDMDILLKSFLRMSLGDFEMKRNRRVLMDKDLLLFFVELFVMVLSVFLIFSKFRFKFEIFGCVICF